jgi:nucleotide-binding universal stress UspA family protein
MRTPAERHIVVGVDGSAEADAALSFAVTEARLRGLRLRVVCAWEPSASAYVGEAFAATADAFLAAEHHADDVLHTALERIPHEGVRIETFSVEGRPATVLIEQAVGAELLVVGSRGRGTAKRLFLGSVSNEVVHHAPSPVTVVPLHR